jgi:hypothetical protein
MKKSKYELPHQKMFSSSFHSVISGSASFEDKMCFWRSVIDLRRAHSKKHSIDTIIKAIIEAQGDLHRSVTLLGTEEFYSTHSNDLPQKIREIFLPNSSNCSQLANGSVGNHREQLLESTSDIWSVSPVKGKQQDVRVLGGVGNKMETILSLRRKKKKELFDIIESVLAQSYFSKAHLPGPKKTKSTGTGTATGTATSFKKTNKANK